MTKTLHFLCYLILFAATTLRSQAEPYKPIPLPPLIAEEARQLGSMSDETILKTFRGLSPQKKKIYADSKRRFDPDLDYNDGRQNTQQFDKLLALDDPITGEYLLRQFELHHWDAIAGDLRHWHSPKVVAAFARAAMSDEPYYNLGDNGMEPVSFRSARSMLGMLQTMEGFPPEVREWAKSVEPDMLAFLKKKQHEAESVPQGQYDPNWEKGYRWYERNREVAQKWWRANEKAVLEGRLKDTVPGEPYVAPSQFLQGVTKVWRPEVKTTTTVAKVSSTNSATTSATTPAKAPSQKAEEGPESPTQTFGNLWLWLAGIATLLAAVALILKRKTDKPH